ncbi:CgeB family protein [Desulfonatronum thioautotrophicum]|uniref:CgeB family protein n=1 Tax=Desulfonatronum thioautotrophicum TaxID=617001 RepID=UPI0005EB363F|nr:glycosyltransferase [Desulfonatronum thioautotrophicum]
MTATPLRILTVLPLYGGSLPIGRYCTRALRSLGHTVECFEAPEFHGAFRALKEQRIAADRMVALENSFLQLVAQTILAKVEHFEPDLVLALAQAPLSRQALQRLRRDKVATAMWFVEDYQVFPYWKAFARLYDAFAVIQKAPFFGLLEELDQRNTLYLPLAADPDIHCPLKLSAVDQRRYGSNLSFLGAGYPNRLVAFRQFLSQDFKIWGNDWPAHGPLTPLLQRPGERISPEEAVKIFNAAKINLNLHSSVKAEPLIPDGDFVNPRTFELASCQAFQLVDRRGLLADLFTDEELAVFEDMEGLHVAIRHYLAHTEERQAMSRRARERVLREHTYQHRMTTLLTFLRERLGLGRKQEQIPAQGPSALADVQGPGDVAPGRPESPLDGLSPDLRAQVDGLLRDLNLRSSVRFDDLIWAIRQRQGTLSELETALLFLDAWRKQYLGER